MELTKGQSEVLNYLKDDKVNRVIWSSTYGSGGTFGCFFSLLTLANEIENGVFYYMSKYKHSFSININEISRLLNIPINTNPLNLDVKLENNSIIHFLDFKTENLDLLSFNFLALDSLYQFSDYDYLYLDKLLNNKNKLLIVTNVNNEYIRDKFHNRFLKEELLDSEKFVFNKTSDNPHLPKKYFNILLEIFENKDIFGIWETEKNL